ncbi:MAG: hypothetical protein R3A10_09330 [Caldilineaceae bacterium]
MAGIVTLSWMDAGANIHSSITWFGDVVKTKRSPKTLAPWLLAIPKYSGPFKVLLLLPRA